MLTKDCDVSDGRQVLMLTKGCDLSDGRQVLMVTIQDCETPPTGIRSTDAKVIASKCLHKSSHTTQVAL